jgi:inhibitor of KinA
MQISALGDSALIMRVRGQFEDAPDETLNEVFRAFHLLRDAGIPGVIDLAPSYTSVAIFFDPIMIAKGSGKPGELFDSLAERLREVVIAGAHRGKRVRSTRIVARPVEIPVCYDPEFAVDIDRVAEQAQISASEVVDLHSGSEYRVACIGFVPGFPFLAGLPKKLATPRRDVPRKEIPAGSVGIGGPQTGIYPLRSPGGWNLIGRTRLKLFDPTKDPPTLLCPGDRVRFRVITREEFESFNQ